MTGSWHDWRSRPDGRRYLTFMVRNEHYAIQVHKVHEVVPLDFVTTPSAETGSACGVLERSDERIPVVDLCARWDFREERVPPFPLVIIVRGRGVMAGLLADRLSGVLTIQQAELAPPASVGSDQRDGLFRHVDEAGESISVIPDIETIIRWWARRGEPAIRVGISAA